MCMKDKSMLLLCTLFLILLFFQSTTDAEIEESSCQNFPGPDFCPGGIDDVIANGTDEYGCTIWACKELCPQIASPAPNWCDGGIISSGEIDEKGCQTIPKCLLNSSNTTETEMIRVNISSSKTGIRSIIIEKSENIFFIESEQITAQTNEKILLEENKLFIKTKAGNKEIKILPEEAVSKIKETIEIKKIELKKETATLVYSIKGAKKAKFLFIFPIELEIEEKINAETGEVISITKPWWSFFVKE